MAIDISLYELNLRVDFFLRCKHLYANTSDFDFCFNSITFGNVCFLVFDYTFRFVRVEYCIWESVRTIYCVYLYYLLTHKEFHPFQKQQEWFQLIL